jgi:hypothetical protein
VIDDASAEEPDARTVAAASPDVAGVARRPGPCRRDVPSARHRRALDRPVVPIADRGRRCSRSRGSARPPRGGSQLGPPATAPTPAMLGPPATAGQRRLGTTRKRLVPRATFIACCAIRAIETPERAKQRRLVNGEHGCSRMLREHRRSATMSGTQRPPRTLSLYDRLTIILYAALSYRPGPSDIRGTLYLVTTGHANLVGIDWRATDSAQRCGARHHASVTAVWLLASSRFPACVGKVPSGPGGKPQSEHRLTNRQ